MHELKQKDVTNEREPTSKRPYILIRTATTKTCKKKEEQIVVQGGSWCKTVLTSCGPHIRRLVLCGCRIIPKMRRS